MKKWFFLILILFLVVISWFYFIRDKSEPSPEIVPRNDTVAEDGNQVIKMEDGTIL